MKTNKNDKRVFESTKDVIRWLEKLKRDHPMSVHECQKVDYDKTTFVKVYTDHVIRNRYQGMIDWLKSDEVEGGE